ncbi:1a03f54e-24a4-4c90-8e0b-5be3022e8371 [Sclerotinia trifoliorum]|uniref:1a03f54e-24a4-4c90-8e0b-5be3022e8371 n=1 Tax=Sclerotinia trifoliorum TaxID=28548 RepID=A0A8H2ZR43_9HELO|nr:1a03f54e-24a4-4c90-8e0b-5be3022e8371 [Sclerotinia trifoliorum]
MNIPTPNPHHTTLLTLHQILHLTHHRNKNQHRLSKWYKSFNILRRQITRLLALIPEYVIESSRGKSKVKGKAKERKEREERELQDLIGFMRKDVVGGCYLAFSQLVADNQYATLGLMLMGCLARLYKILESLRVLTAEEIAAKTGTVNEEVKVNEPEIGEDLGEKIVRDAPASKVVEGTKKEEKKEEEDSEIKKSKVKKRKQEGEALERKSSKLSSLDSTPAKPPKKKRKKKGGDAFDDLFDSLM